MNKYDRKVERIEQHLVEYPADYKSVVSFYKNKSKSFEHEKRQSANRKKAVVAKYRRSHEE